MSGKPLLCLKHPKKLLSVLTREETVTKTKSLRLAKRNQVQARPKRNQVQIETMSSPAITDNVADLKEMVKHMQEQVKMSREQVVIALQHVEIGREQVKMAREVGLRGIAQRVELAEAEKAYRVTTGARNKRFIGALMDRYHTLEHKYNALDAVSDDLNDDNQRLATEVQRLTTEHAEIIDENQRLQTAAAAHKVDHPLDDIGLPASMRALFGKSISGGLRAMATMLKHPKFRPMWRIAAAHLMANPHLLEGCMSDFNKLIEKYPL